MALFYVEWNEPLENWVDAFSPDTGIYEVPDEIATDEESRADSVDPVVYWLTEHSGWIIPSVIYPVIYGMGGREIIPELMGVNTSKLPRFDVNGNRIDT